MGFCFTVDNHLCSAFIPGFENFDLVARKSVLIAFVVKGADQVINPAEGFAAAF